MTYEVGGSPAEGTNQISVTCEPAIIGRNKNGEEGTAGLSTVTKTSFACDDRLT